MQHLPRIFATVILLSFFLPWVSFSGSIFAILGPEMQLSFSGLTWCTEKGGATWIMLGTPIFAGIAALVNTPKGYMATGIFGLLCLMAGPAALDTPFGAVSFSYGWYLLIASLFGMMISGQICTEE